MGTASLAIAATPNFVTPPPGFHDTYRRYSEAVYKTALRVTGNPSDAEDVMQNVFLRILDHELTLDPMWSPERYLRRAATNASIDLLRKKTSLAETDLADGREYGTRESAVIVKQRLRQALARLPEADAELFALCYLEGYTYEELSEQFELERGTVASRLHRIRAVLQKELSK
jgi:RNA polymerase sigma-70 factor (ECF subfamily)